MGTELLRFNRGGKLASGVVILQRQIPYVTTSAKALVSWTLPNGDRTDFHIHSPITKEPVPFITRNRRVISWYACGPTVYDFSHIGHACSYLRLDIIRRILEKYTRKKVVQVMCVTDIDDKIIRKAKQLRVNWKVLASTYEKEFFADLRSLNILSPSFTCRASDFVPQMIEFVQCLLDKNMAYKASDGSVYFSIKNYGRHGKLRPLATHCAVPTHQDVDTVASKEFLADFALWKGVKPDEPFWKAPWGCGRPGWHLECSTIASEYFGNSVDIHSGGSDLIFPHHENEESQCCAYHRVSQWVNYWLHTGCVVADGEKMSKSLGNTMSIREYLNARSAAHLRMLCLSTGYRSNVEITGEESEASAKLCVKFLEFFDDCRAYLKGYCVKGDIDDVKLLQILEKTETDVDSCLKNDFDTKGCVRCLLQLMSETRSMFQAELGRRNPVMVYTVYAYVKNMMDIFGFEWTEEPNTSRAALGEYAEKIDDILDACVTFRSSIRRECLAVKRSENASTAVLGDKLLKLCDNFRHQFSEYGVEIKDRKNDVATWNRIKPPKK